MIVLTVIGAFIGTGLLTGGLIAVIAELENRDTSSPNREQQPGKK